MAEVTIKLEVLMNLIEKSNSKITTVHQTKWNDILIYNN